jgi:hypothetical protein
MRGRVAIDADAINLPQPVRQHTCEVDFVLCDGLYADGSDETDPGGQPGRCPAGSGFPPRAARGTPRAVRGFPT